MTAIALNRHPEVLGAAFLRRASKDARPGPSPFEALPSKGRGAHLRVTVHRDLSEAIKHRDRKKAEDGE